MSWLKVDRGLVPSDVEAEVNLDPFLKPEYRSGRPFLPSPTLEFLNSSREVSETISQGNDLNLEFVDGVRRCVSLDLRNGHEGAGRCADQRTDVTLSFFGPGDIDHEVSFQWGSAPEVGLLRGFKLTVRPGTGSVEVSFPSRVGTGGDGAAGIPPSAAPDSP